MRYDVTLRAKRSDRQQRPGLEVETGSSENTFREIKVFERGR